MNLSRAIFRQRRSAAGRAAARWAAGEPRAAACRRRRRGVGRQRARAAAAGGGGGTGGGGGRGRRRRRRGGGAAGRGGGGAGGDARQRRRRRRRRGAAAAGRAVGAGAAAGGRGHAGTAAPAVDASRRSTLRSAAAQTGRLIGAALAPRTWRSPPTPRDRRQQFNFVTPENEMKWDATEPTQNVFTFERGDAIVAFAAAERHEGQGAHAGLALPAAGLGFEHQDATDLHDAMINHITQVASHFRGKVMAWDVVNEAVADGGQSLRATRLLQFLGAGYIDDAFKAAHAADPDARLYYNDYGAEGMGAKSDAVYNMVQGMLARGVPIHGVGLQMHTGPADVAVGRGGCRQHAAAGGARPRRRRSARWTSRYARATSTPKAARFHDIVADCVAQPLCLAVTVWGVTDKYSWLNGQSCATPRPLLFDDNYAPKPAYAGVLNAFLGL